MKLSISHTEMNMQYMIKSYHAPEPRVVNTNTTSRTVITEDLHPQGNNVSTETWCTISCHKYRRVISNNGPWVNIWWSMWASSFETWSINTEAVYAEPRTWTSTTDSSIWWKWPIMFFPAHDQNKLGVIVLDNHNMLRTIMVWKKKIVQGARILV